jgi:hypothetical protein
LEKKQKKRQEEKERVEKQYNEEKKKLDDSLSDLKKEVEDMPDGYSLFAANLAECSMALFKQACSAVDPKANLERLRAMSLNYKSVAVIALLKSRLK